MTKDIITLLEELRGIAQTGLFYTENPYDRERYQRLWQLTLQTYQELTNLPQEILQERFLADLGSITPKVGANAAIFNPKGQILLLDRADGLGWCLPCGWVDPNEKPVEAVVREVKEETNLEVKVGQLVGVFTQIANQETGFHSLIAIVHLCRIQSGAFEISHESNDIRYFALDSVQNWAPGHQRYAQAAYRMWKAQDLLPPISD
jgi:ADP-ribose pyrophosphatase YjhB (NUDIX family)